MRVAVPDPCLVILCGPAGCGKSTFARRNFPQTAIVSSDRCRAMIADDESDIRVSADAFALFHQIIEHRLGHRRLTVADSTALHPDARRDLRKIARRWSIPVAILVFDVPEEACQRWDARRQRRVGRAVIRRQRQQLQQALACIPGEGYEQVVVLGEADVATARVEVAGRASNEKRRNGMEIKRVGVVGCGLMGAGIVEVCARSGYDVVVREVSDDLLRKGLGRVEGSMRRGVERGKLPEPEMQAARRRIKGTLQLADLGDADLIIEAIVEKMEPKKEVFRELDRLCPATTVFASNTSSLSITEMASATGRPDRFLGMHFFNPVPVMKLVELIRGLQTSEETVAEGRRFAESVGKTVVVCKDSPGFIVNLLLVPYLLDAVRALELGIATKEDIDTAVQLGLAHPMGPLTLLDYVGIDTTYYIAQAMFEEVKDPRYAAPPLLKQMVLAGRHGRKTGRGFYDYPGETR